MSSNKANVYNKDIEIWLKNVPKFAKDCNYLRKNLLHYIRHTKRQQGIKGIGGLLPSVNALVELSNSYLRLGDKLLKSGLLDRPAEPNLSDLILQDSKDDK